jgi:hypothetical protein
MAITQAQLNAMVSAWASGATRVTYDGRTVEYRSRQDLESQIATAAAALGLPNPLAPAKTPGNRKFAAYDSGL